MTRNKFDPSIDEAASTINNVEQYVPAGKVKRNSETILATEFWADYHLVCDPQNLNVCKSHRTVSGYVQIINGGPDLTAGLSAQPPQADT